jgi:hypothetical protein
MLQGRRSPGGLFVWLFGRKQMAGIAHDLSPPATIGLINRAKKYHNQLEDDSIGRARSFDARRGSDGEK